MGLSSLVADATSVVDGVLNAFGLSDSDPRYPPSLGALVSNTIVENDRSWQKSLGYGFEVVRVGTDGAISRGPSGPAGGETWKPFTLQINPQELSQDEIFAIEVTPTFSGVLVEHQGTTLKDIVISGTTGMSPNRNGEGGAFPQSGRPVLATGHSGYFEFHELRTYFRAYVEQKRNDPGRDEGELRLVWRNLKDHEDLFVEPQKFSMKRGGGKAHLYEYVIQLKGIGIAKDLANDKGYGIDDFIQDVQDGLDTGVKLIQGTIGFAERVERDITNTLLNPVRAIAAAMRSLRTGQQRLDRVKQRAKSIKSNVDKTLDIGKLITDSDKKAGGSQAGKNFQKAYQASVNAAKEDSDKSSGTKAANLALAAAAGAINKKAVQDLKDKAQAIYDNMADLAGVDTAAYNAYKGKVATLTADVKGKALTYEESKALYAINTVVKALTKMAATVSLFQEDTGATARAAEAIYRDALSSKEKSANLIIKQQAETALAAAKVSGDVAAVLQIQKAQKQLLQQEALKAGQSAKDIVLTKTGTTAKLVDVGGGDTIQTIAARYLGNPDRFKELVILNGLRPPYLDSVPLETDPVRVAGVLRPGDKIYIPTKGQGSTPQNAILGSDYPISQGLSAIEKGFGIDIQLTDDYDIAVSNTGDVKLVAGTQNVAQGLLVKLLLEVGALKRHPEIGGGLEVGGKALHLSQTLDQVRRSLEKDNRVQSVIFAEIRQAGSSVFLNMILTLKNVDQPVAIPLKVA